MKKLDRVIEKVGHDKVLHFVVAYAMTATGLMFSVVMGLVMTAAVVVLSVVKELWLDERADWMDLVAGVMGCCLCWGMVVMAWQHT